MRSAESILCVSGFYSRCSQCLFFNGFSHIIFFQLLIKRMFVHQQGSKVRNEGSNQQLKDHTVAVSHLQHKDGRSKWSSCNTCEKANHPTEDKQIGIGSCKMKKIREQCTNRS